MKKIIALLLSLMLCMGSIVPVMAVAAPMQEELSSITLEVKSRIPDTSQYTQFDGNLEERAGCRYWNLEWRDEAGNSLYVVVARDGHILSYSRYRNESSASVSRSDGYAPQIEQLDEQTIRDAAQSFVDDMMMEGESCQLEELEQSSVTQRKTTRCTLRGQMQVNGLPSILSVSVTVDPRDMTVLDYNCYEMQDGLMADVDAPTPTVQQNTAEPLLTDTLKLKAEYTTTGSGEENTAVLRYLPVYTHDYMVDAHTGELLDLTDMEQTLSAPSAGNDTAEDTSSAEKGELSEAEQAGIRALEGVLDQNELDTKLREAKEFGLNGYSLTRTAYWADDEGKQVTATLYYEKGSGEQLVRKYICVDARTVEPLSINTIRQKDETGKAGPVDAQTVAKNFVETYWPQRAAQCAVYERPSAVATPLQEGPYQNVTMAQQQDGYFYPDNCFHVGINTQDGTVDSFYWTYNDEIKLVKPEQVISPNQAMETYRSCFDIQLGYQLVLREDAQQRLQNNGGCIYQMKLGYTLEQKEEIQAIDVGTGARIDFPENTKELRYSDTEGWQGGAQLLQYGIGYPGSRFDGNAAVTQKDLLALLLSADGYYYQEDSGQEGIDALYERAKWSGILTVDQRNPDHQMTRAEVAALLVSMSGYGRTASLADIYVCRFGDAASIPREYYGYVATAQGMGIVSGDANGNFRPNDVATRGEAAQMFYAFLQRKI